MLLLRLLLALFLVVCGSSAAVAQERYASATVKGRRLVIETTDGKARRISPEKGQEGFEEVAVSADGRAVDWLTMMPTCCTSYPISMKLVMLVDGRIRTFTGEGLPVFDWLFRDGGSRFAFRQETVHGGLGIHYELHDVVTGRLLEEFSPPYDNENNPILDARPPRWVDEFDAEVTQRAIEATRKIK